MTARRALAYAIPIAVIAIVGIALARGPLYRAYSMEECLKAYQGAETRGDTARIDLHPYRNERDNRRVRHTCGEVRAVPAADSLPVVSR